MAKNSEYLMSLPEAAEKLGWNADSKGANVVTTTTKVTGKGQIYFVNKFLG